MKLEEELSDTKSAGFMRRLVLRSEDEIITDINKIHSLIEDESKNITEQKNALASIDWEAKLMELFILMKQQKI